jgi:hypothetical protein
MKANQGAVATVDRPKLPIGKRVTNKEVEIHRIETFWETGLYGRKLSFEFTFRFDVKDEQGEMVPFFFRQSLGFSVNQKSGFPLLKNNSRLFGFLEDVLQIKIEVDKGGFAKGKYAPDFGFPVLGGVNPDELHEPNELLGYFNTCVMDKEAYWEEKRAGGTVDSPEMRYFKVGEHELIGFKFPATFEVNEKGWPKDLKRYVPVQEVEI